VDDPVWCMGQNINGSNIFIILKLTKKKNKINKYFFIKLIW